MSAIANTVQTYDRKGLREDLTDIIFNIAPTETPFMSNIGRGTCEATLNEWQEDTLATPDGSNAQIEGNDYTTFAAAAATVRYGNYTQISSKVAIVAGTVNAVKKAGRSDEMAYQIAKRGKEWKRDVETIMLRPQGGAAGSSSVARTLASMLAWVKTNVDFDAVTTPGVNPVYGSGVPSAARTDGTLRAFSETILKNVMVLCYTNGAEPTTLMVGPVNKQRISGFAGIATKTIQQTAVKAAAIIGAADFYVSDFGTLAVVPNRFQRERDAWFLDFEFIRLKFLRKMQTEALAKTGDAEKRLLLGEYTLEVGTEKSQGGAFDLQTT